MAGTDLSGGSPDTTAAARFSLACDPPGPVADSGVDLKELLLGSHNQRD